MGRPSKAVMTVVVCRVRVFEDNSGCETVAHAHSPPELELPSAPSSVYPFAFLPPFPSSAYDDTGVPGIFVVVGPILNTAVPLLNTSVAMTPATKPITTPLLHPRLPCSVVGVAPKPWPRRPCVLMEARSDAITNVVRPEPPTVDTRARLAHLYLTSCPVSMGASSPPLHRIDQSYSLQSVGAAWSICHL